MHLRDSWIFLWQGFSKDFRVAPILSRDFSSFLLRNLIHWIHQIFVNFLFNPRTNETQFLFNSMIFSFEKIPLPFFPNKRDYLRAVSLYYSFDSVHPEFRTWIYIGNMSNTRLTLLWENINFFFFIMYLGYTQFDTDFCMLEEDEERGYREYRDFGIRGVWIGGVYKVNRVRCLSMFILEFCSSTSFTLWSRRAS